MKDVKLARTQLDSDHAGAGAINNNHVHHLKLIEKRHLILDALLIKRLQNHVPGAVSRVAGAPHQRFAEVARMPAEAALADALLRGAVEGQAHVLKFDDRVNRVLRQNLRRCLVGKVVAALDRVIGMINRLVFIEVAQSRADAALRRARVAAGRVELADDRDIRAAFAGVKRRHQTSAARAYDNRIVFVNLHSAPTWRAIYAARERGKSIAPTGPRSKMLPIPPAIPRHAVHISPRWPPSLR